MPAESYDITRFAHDTLGNIAAPAKRLFVWGHGWGQNRHSMAGLAQSLSGLGDHILVDFPGFGDTPKPQGAWTTADYADLAARLLRELSPGSAIVWVGHSFGGRVGIQLAARHPDLVSHLVLIAAAGLQRQRSLAEQVRLKGRIYTFKALKQLAPLVGMDVAKLRDRFGSSDYKAAGDMREILGNVVREDLTEQAAAITCPTRLIYGENDTETPPEIGRRLAALIKGSQLSVLPGQDHYTLLSTGRHQVARRIRDFVEQAT